MKENFVEIPHVEWGGGGVRKEKFCSPRLQKRTKMAVTENLFVSNSLVYLMRSYPLNKCWGMGLITAKRRDRITQSHRTKSFLIHKVSPGKVPHFRDPSDSFFFRVVPDKPNAIKTDM